MVPGDTLSDAVMPFVVSQDWQPRGSLDMWPQQPALRRTGERSYYFRSGGSRLLPGGGRPRLQWKSRLHSSCGTRVLGEQAGSLQTA